MDIHDARLTRELGDVIDDADVDPGRYVSPEDLAREDSFERAVVGLAGESHPVVVAWQSPHHAISGYPIGAEYPGRERRQLSKAEGVDDLEAWIYEQGEDYWRWLHPRFRWLFNGGSECLNTD